MRRLLLLGALVACNQPPETDDLTVDFRPATPDGPTTGERGTVKVSEIHWSGSVRNDGTYDPDDVFIEFRNEGARPINLSGWRIIMTGAREQSWRIPDSDYLIDVGEEVYVAAKDDGCFRNATYIIPGLSFPTGDAFEITIRDNDKRLMEPAGSETAPPFAGGYDFVSSRSMERIPLMFGGVGSEPASWHHYNRLECPNSVIGGNPDNEFLNCYEQSPNNDNVSVDCRRHTLASPGRPNSKDYSGAYSSGGFE